MLLAYDFGKGGQLTTRGSYLIPSLLSLQMTFGYLMASQCLQMKRFWIFACLFFLSVSTVSSFVLVSSNTWWHKADENIHHEVAAIINQAESPLVISDVEFSLPISLSHSLTADTQYILLPPPDADAGWQLPEIPDDNFSDIFLYRPSELLQTELGQATGVELETLIEQTDNYCNCTPQVLVKVSTTSS
jgi:Na+/H+ antiporter NhaA